MKEHSTASSSLAKATKSESLCLIKPQDPAPKGQGVGGKNSMRDGTVHVHPARSRLGIIVVQTAQVAQQVNRKDNRGGKW